ncbi:HET domain-containing protein [Colletotrichum tabaci]|uniref:HET domain-containing protein n=1 Tax=Colletotrichum tabaci TaxID=1209068 RepID=A0AAV9TA08_9PEZI
MRVINTETLELEEFHDLPRRPYVILSHTWGSDEVSFEEMMMVNCQKEASSEARSSIMRKHGFEKIRATCAKATGDGFSYAWIDTCCIDKKSSAELSEAINSMFRYYEASAICYAYLTDVPTASQIVDLWDEEEGFDRDGLFGASRWFTRGWTLQELLASGTVEFYAADWTEIGTKSSLVTHVARITRINPDVLADEKPISECNAAERLSWAARRETTRVEDIAYSLLGIMGVTMPLLYGEGKHAFVRLQEAVMKEREDYTLMLGGLATYIIHRIGSRKSGSLLSISDISMPGDWEYSPPLAESPSSFLVQDPDVWSYGLIHSGSTKPPFEAESDHESPSLSPRGLRVSLPQCFVGDSQPRWFESQWFDTRCMTREYHILILLEPSRHDKLCYRRYERAYALARPSEVSYKGTPGFFIVRPASIFGHWSFSAGHGRLDVPKPEWTLDASAMSPDLEVEWLHGNFAHSLGVGYKGLIEVVALGWCARAAGEQEGFLLVFGNDWGHVVHETEMSDRGVAIDEIRAGSGVALQRAVPIAGKFKHSDRVVLHLRTTAILASFRRRGSSEEHRTLKLTTSQKARGSS